MNRTEKFKKLCVALLHYNSVLGSEYLTELYFKDMISMGEGDFEIVDTKKGMYVLDFNNNEMIYSADFIADIIDYEMEAWADIIDLELFEINVKYLSNGKIVMEENE